MSLIDHEDGRPCEADGCPCDASRGSRYCHDHIRSRSGNYPEPTTTTLDALGPVLEDD